MIEGTKYKIVCVGGTGQMVLHYYLQLYLLGEIKHPFEAVVVDTDEIISSITTIQNFFSDLQYGSDAREALGAEVPIIKTIRITPQEADSVSHALTGRRDTVPPEFHPARAFFHKDTLTQDLKQGLFARPALSSVISHDVLHNVDLRPHADSTVVVVGSVLGGTSGGLAAPIMYAIHRRILNEDIEKVQVRVVLFGEYFTPDAGVIEGEVVRFKSNQTFVTRAIKEALEDIHSFHIVGGPGESGAFKRKQAEEKAGEFMPWPNDAENPFWRGTQALEHLLTDTTKDKAIDFQGREVEAIEDRIKLPAAQLSLEQRLSLVDKFIRKKCVTRIANDPFARFIWGSGLINVIAHFWSIAAKAEGGRNRLANFPADIQHSLEAIWYGSESEAGLQKVFPNLTNLVSVSPKNIRRITWHEIYESRRHEKLFKGSGAAARKAAATILFSILREGK